ncbi:DUF5906 domain-containing protein [Lysinibacillus sphaericus]|uniref:phage NrS-1 polymerase family protein n=1 Tax=Lysinibacillus sphaericus TaxID=1421 RepID=UPI0018CCE49B|nr:DUF5906 domain-containing protein [Lysinibacillus sphaericus]
MKLIFIEIIFKHGIDIDKCYFNGEFNEVSKEILSIFKGLAYAEFSPSGKGIHLIVRGKKETLKSKNSEIGLEIYDSKRYFTVTGNKISGYDEIRFCSNEINRVCKKFLERKEEDITNMNLNAIQDYHLSNEKILELMFKNKGGDRLQSLYFGDWEGYYTSKSEADLAFCNALAFYSNKNSVQMDNIYRMSKLYNRKWDEIHYIEVYTYREMVLQKSIEGTTFTYNPNSFNISRPKKESTQVKKIDERVPKIPRWYKESGNSLSFMPGILAKYLSESKRYFYAYERFYLYENGVYGEVPINKIKREIQGHLLEEYSKSHHIIDTLEQLKNKVEYEEDILNSKFYSKKINFKNGMYDVKEERLEAHNPNMKSVIQINSGYISDAECPYFLNFLNKTLDEKDVLIAQELLGYLMVPDTSAEKAFILYGPGRTGKSTFLKLIELLIGKKHISNVPLQSLSDKFKTSLFFGKLVNIYADLPNKPLEDTGIFKTFKEEEIDTTLLIKFESEIAGITQWALQGLKRLMANNYQFTKSETTQKLLAEYRKQSNNVIWFVEDFCGFSTDNSIYSREIYQYYKKVCIENNMQPISQTKFNKALETEYKTQIIRTLDNDKRVIYKGIKINK